jgi:type I restriction enzyme R subunit
MANKNQNPEQIARDKIDQMLIKAGWLVQDYKKKNLAAAKGVAVREVHTSEGDADYGLFVNRKPVGVIEAKRVEEGHRITVHEAQAEGYAKAKIKHLNNEPLPFMYVSTGERTEFVDFRDPKPRSREVFSFHRPETMEKWLKNKASLRARLHNLPELNKEGLRPAQIIAIENLETSFKENRPRGLIQMATGAGKTFTACTFAYRLLKYSNAKRILFLVDTKNLGEQAEQEFMSYQPKDDNRTFTELYNVQRLTSSYIAKDSQICISTIQRMYSILQDKEIDEKLEEENPNEKDWQLKEPLPVVYNERNPIEQFDFIVIDECHRSIYNRWRQVLDYYDAFLIGLTATPDSRTFGFFNNLVSEYTYEESVIDGVNVPYNVWRIETEITEKGAVIKANESIERRAKLSRKKRWEQVEEDYEYKKTRLDKDVINPSQIRLIIKEFKRILPQIFPERHFEKDGTFEVPKTLVFAKTDSHADDIIKVVREEFGEGNDFCKKVTYKIKENPKTILSQFRNSWSPRIAVTVDMIATGTDVKPLEILLFMRDVRSANYFEQMKGRGTRTIKMDDLQRVTRTAKHTKTHFIVIDAVGVTKSKKTSSRPLERKPSASLKSLLDAVAIGATDEDLFTSLANRLLRLNKQITETEQAEFKQKTNGKSISNVVKDLLNAYDPDVLEAKTDELMSAIPEADKTPTQFEECEAEAQETLCNAAGSTFNGELNEFIEKVRQVHEQLIDHINQDVLLRSEFDSFSKDKAADVVKDFTAFLEANKDEITALGFFYNEPYRLRELTFQMIQDILTELKRSKPTLAPHYVWDAFAQLETVNDKSPKNELVALVSLIRKVTKMDETLTDYNKTVDKNFQRWVFTKQAGALKFNGEQMDWLRLMKEHVAQSFHIELDDLDYTPFDAQGGRGKMYQLFEKDMGTVITELNEALIA